jgi:hypothetical protein
MVLEGSVVSSSARWLWAPLDFFKVATYWITGGLIVGCWQEK